MKNLNQDYEYPRMEQMSGGARNILAGILIGGLVGATAMMFFAPRSGEEMRAELMDKAVDIRDRTTDTVKDKVSGVVSKASNLKGGVKGKTDDLKSMGQDMLVEQLDRAMDALATAKKAVKQF
jgi:gas vesicle protein